MGGGKEVGSKLHRKVQKGVQPAIPFMLMHLPIHSSLVSRSCACAKGPSAIPLLMPEAAVTAQDADSDIHTPESRPRKHNLANVSPAFLTQSFSICTAKTREKGGVRKVSCGRGGASRERTRGYKGLVKEIRMEGVKRGKPGAAHPASR